MIRILAVGDSNTYGYDPESVGGSRYSRMKRWTGILDAEPGFTVNNAGENGVSIPRSPENAAAWLSSQIDRWKCDVITLMLGTNDLLNMNVPSAQTVAERMAAFLDVCIRTDRRIADILLLIAPPAMDPGLWTDTRTVEESLRLGDYYRYVADYYKLRFVDASQWGLPTCRDGVHLTAIGHQVFAENLMQVLSEDSRMCKPASRENTESADRHSN
jgi:lysophospholipase L1-like esterase